VKNGAMHRGYYVHPRGGESFRDPAYGYYGSSTATVERNLARKNGIGKDSKDEEYMYIYI